MKTALAAIIAVSTFGSSQQASAETLMDILFPKAKPDIAGTSRPRLDNAPTGSVANPPTPATVPADARPEKQSYPEAILWSFP
jgi:hypothetical protein